MQLSASVIRLLPLTLLAGLLLFTERAAAQCVASIGVDASSSLEICDGGAVKFLDESTGSPLNRIWDFGDGSATSNANDPSHQYTLTDPTSDQVFTVTLDRSCVGGASDQATVQVTVRARPQVDFTVDTTTVCAFSDSICFTNLSDIGPGYDFNWNFGDLNASSQQTPCHIYNNAGTYDVTLQVTNDNGCFNELTKEDYIEALESPSPNFNLDVSTGCVPVTVSVTNNTSDPDNSIVGWSWSWGDLSTPSTGFTPNPHTYTDPDFYQIELTATNSFNCQSSTNLTFQAKVTPEATLEIESPVCLGADAQVTYTGDAPITATYNWSSVAGTMSPASGQGPVTASFTESGIQTVELEVVEDGCTATGSAEVVVFPEPYTELSSDAIQDTACQGQEVTFSVQPAVYQDYEFLVEGVIEAQGTSASFTTDALSDGDEVTVIVQDWLGCEGGSDTISLVVVSGAAIALTASDDSVCLGGSITYDADPGFDNYAFYDNSALVQDGASASLTYSGFSQGSSISVVGSIASCEFTSAVSMEPEVLEPLPNPVVNCGQTSESEIEFVWAEIEDAALYEIQLEAGAFEATTGALNHELTGLGMDSAVTAIIRAIGSSQCGDTTISAAVTCSTIVCDPINFTIAGSTTTCTGVPVELEAVDLSTSNFTLDWDGNGAGTATTFELDGTADANIMVELVDLDQPACPPFINSFSLTVSDTPAVAMTISENSAEICLGEFVEFTATPTGLDNYDFRVNNATVQSSTANIFGSTSLENGDIITVVATQGGCSSEVDAGVTITEIVEDPLEVAQPVCGVTTTSSIEFNWFTVDDATGYEVSIDGGPFVTASSGATGLTHVMTGLTPGDEHTIIVSALGPDPCGASGLSLPATCFVQDCEPVTFDKSTSQEVCQGEGVTVTISDLSTAEFSVSWAGEPFGSDLSRSFIANADTNVFIQLIDSTQLSCPPTTQFVPVKVTPQPVTQLASSSDNDTICSSTSLVFTATPGGYDQYDFIRGFEILQTGSSNTYTAADWEDGDSLFVIASNGTCQGDSSNVITTRVFDELSAPQLNCGVTTDTSITFVWDPILGAEGYEISTNGVGFTTGSAGSTGLEHYTSGLTAGDEITLYVRALGEDPCGNSVVSAPLTCEAIPCIPATFERLADQEVCEGDDVTVSISNVVTNSGSFEVTWDGVPSNQDLAQTFTLNTTQSYEVSVADPIEPVSCPATTKFIELTANEIPQITISSNAVNDSICDDVDLTLSASPQGYDLYEFTLNTQLMQADGNHAFVPLTWQDSDVLSVVPTNRGCVGPEATFSDDIVQGTALTAPQVNCGESTSSSITFQWDAIDGASGYEVSVDGAPFIDPSTGLMGVSHVLTGLDSGAVASIEVRAFGTLPCGDSELSLQAFCKVIDCPELDYTLTASDIVCEDEVWGLSLSNLTIADYSVSWNDGPYGDDLNFGYQPSQDTLVKVEVRNNQKPECAIVTKSTEVEIVAAPNATLATNDLDHVICEGDPVQFTAGPLGQFDYSFYAGFELLQSGINHRITRTDLEDGERIDVVVSLLGCSDTAIGTAFTVNEPLLSPQPNCSTTTSSDVIVFWDAVAGANGYEISVDGGVYAAPNGATFHTVSGLSASDEITATVRVLGDPPCGDTEGAFTATCAAEDCEGVDFTMSPDIDVCAGTPVNLTISGLTSTSGNNDFSVVWNADAGATNLTYAYTAFEDTTIAVTVIDNTNPSTCVGVTKYFVLDVQELPSTTVTLNSTGAECEGDSLEFDASPKRYDNYEFFYNGVTSIQSSANPVLIVDTLSDGAEITVIATENGCGASTASSSGTVTLNPRPDVTLVTSSGSTVTCFGQQVSFVASSGMSNYRFYNGSLLLQDSTINTLTSSLITDGDSISVIAQSSDGCVNVSLSAGSFVEIEVQDLPTVSLGASTNDTICEAQNVVFTATPAGLTTYDFSIDGIMEQSSSSNTATISSIEDGQRVAVVATNAAGCSSEARYSVSYPVKPLPDLVTSGDTAFVCQNDTLTLTASDTTNGNATAITWQGGTSTGTSFEIVPSSPTNVAVTGTLNGCSLTANISVQIDTDFPVLNTGVIQTVCLGDSIELSVSGAKSYAWVDVDEIGDTTSATPYATPSDTAARAYTVIGTNDGCSTTGTALVLIDRCLDDLPEDPPDAISPNGDGNNDSWTIKDVDYFTESAMIIYNRWGNVVYESAPFLGWDGTSTKGKMLPDGTYYYVLTLNNGTSEAHTGFILIHR